MEEEFLTHYRREPRPEFSQMLYRRINQPMPTKSTSSLRASVARLSPALAVLSVFLAAVLLFSLPATRAAAQDFLNLFRVKKFTAISVDPARLEQLRNSNVDFETLLGNSVHVVKQAKEPQSVSGPAEAAQATGLQVRVPSELPVAGHLSSTYVQGEAVAEITGDTQKLQSVLELLNIDDVKVPEKLNGAKITVKKPAAVMLRYAFGSREATLIESRSPEVTLPDGVDLAQLGEIALRAAGMSKDEAHSFARSIDWHSTLLVPVPANAASFREVDVDGTKGLMITTNGNGGAGQFGRGTGRDSS